ncbi:TPA: hypothetical protein ACH3X3_008626 [Trebouxia sp. C0006]
MHVLHRPTAVVILGILTVIIPLAACSQDNFCQALKSNLHSTAMQLVGTAILLGDEVPCLQQPCRAALAVLWLYDWVLTLARIADITCVQLQLCMDQPLCVQQLLAVVLSRRPQYTWINWH